MLRTTRTGHRQVMLILLGVIGLASFIAIGIARFGAHNISANKRGITQSLLGLAADAHQYRLRPTILGGGGNSYLNYDIPDGLKSDRYGRYSAPDSPGAASITFSGVSSFDTAWVARCLVDSEGNTALSYQGW